MKFEEGFLRQELYRTHPDYIVYVPCAGEGRQDHGNEHFHVFPARDGGLCALWTMSEFEGTHSQRPVFSRSHDGGRTWTPPRSLLRDPIDPATGRNMGSWAAAAVSRSGRIYVLFAKHLGDGFDHECGRMVAICSDDCGATWSDEAPVPLPRSHLDPDGEGAAISLFPWQNAQRLSDGTVLMGLSHNWKHPSANPEPRKYWPECQGGCEFARFDNIDDDPAPPALRLSFFARNEAALNAPMRTDPARRSGEEPAFVELPDGRLFCVFRACEGHVWYSVSEDSGETWRPCEPLRFHDGGEAVPHPYSPCPLFRVSDGEYVLFTHNHDGFNGRMDRPDTSGNWRNPVFILKGEFRPKAHQPVWFSAPAPFMDNGGVAIARMDLALYASLTIEGGTPVLWYPDRKFFLLGRRIERPLLDSLVVKGM